MKPFKPQIIGYEEGSLGMSVVIFIDEDGKKQIMLQSQFEKKYGKVKK